MVTARIKKIRKIPDVISFSQAMMRGFKPGSQAYIIWLMSLVFVFFQFLLQLSSGEIVDGLMKSFDLTALGGGLLASAYYYIYVALQTPAGVMIDHFGPRKILTIGAVVVMLGCVMFGEAPWTWVAFLARLLMGAGAAFAFVGSLNLVRKWFPKERFALFAGVAETIGMVGSLFGGTLLAYLVTHYGWRYCMLGAGAIAAVIAILLFAIIRDAPAHKMRYGPRPKRRVLPGLRVLVRSKVAWINGIYSGIMFAIVTVFAALWGIPFMQAAHHLSLVQATVLCNMVMIGVAIGGPLFGWLDGRFHCRKAVLISCAASATVLFVLVIASAHDQIWKLVVYMILLGVCASSYVLTFAIANDIAFTRIKGASIGFVNTLSVGTAPLLQPLVGLILYLLSRGAEHNATHHYTVHEYQMALVLMPVLCLIAIGLASKINVRRR